MSSSHDRQHQLPPPGNFDPEAGTTAAGDHGPLTSPAEFYPPPPQPPPESIGISVPEPLEVMPDRPRAVSPLEKWAAHATSSQFNALSGAIGGFTSGVVVCPLDVIKTKLQAQGGFAAVQKGRHVGHHRVYSGLLGTGKTIWRDEGIRGLYRGLGPIILGYLPTWAVWFTVYNKSKEFLGEHHKNSFFINFWSSIVAGASSTIVTNPIWVIKTRLMSQSARDHIRTSYSQFPKGSNTPTSRPTLHSPWHYKSTLDAARKMYTTEGITSFYSGLTPALLGLTHVAVQFPAYEFLKTKFTGQGMGAVALDKEGHQAANQWTGVLAATILSKVLASSATYPHEVIRTRLQTQQKPMVGNGSSKSGGGTPRYQGIVRTFSTILHEEGWRAFYAGMGTNLMRAVPAATVTMLTYEYVMRTLNQAKADGERLIGEVGGMTLG